MFRDCERLWQFDDLLGQFMQNVDAHISKNGDMFAMKKISTKNTQ